MAISKTIMMWIVLFILFAVVSALFTYMPDWLKENDVLNVIILVSVGFALAIGFMYIAWR